MNNIITGVCVISPGGFITVRREEEKIESWMLTWRVRTRAEEFVTSQLRPLEGKRDGGV